MLPKYLQEDRGFSITDTRTIFLDGELVKTETRVSTYRAVSGVRCG